jgi:hypothetical protein
MSAMGLDLDETARILTHKDGGESLCMRAIRLFEFQSYLFYPESATGETGTQKSARLLAAMKLLEHLEKRIRATSNRKDISAQDVADDPDSAEIFEKVIMRSGGWRAIRYTWSSDDFDRELKIRIDEARSAAKIVDFSYRFARLRSNDRRKGGVTMAFSIVCNSPSYKFTKGLSTLKTRWREYGETAGFLYLLLFQKFELMPPGTKKRTFSETLLTQAADIDHLIEFFRAYRHLCEVLKTRGLEFAQIRAFEELPSSELVVEPFQSDVQKEIDTYTSA